MNKSERERLATLENEIRLAKALRFTSADGPDVPIPEGFKRLVKGWSFLCHISVTVRAEPSCSSSVGHATGQDHETRSQRPISQYSSKLRALLAARVSAERQCAEILAACDREIEEELKARR